MKSALFAVGVAALTFSGCAAQQVVDPPPDPFESSTAGPAFPGLKLGVVIGDVTSGDGYDKVPMTKAYPKSDVVPAAVEILRANFSSISRVDNSWQAQTDGLDLVATVTIDWLKSGQRGSYDKLTIALAIVDSQKRPIETITVAGKSMGFHDFGLAPARFGDTFGKAQSRALIFLSRAVKQSSALAVYAKERGALPTATARIAPLPAPVHAAKTFRADAETPSFSRSDDPAKFAVIIGVEKYSDLPPAEHAARDAKAIKSHLLALGYPERNIIYLTDQKALKTGLEKYVESWLPRNVDENSTVFFYFSGHGSPDPSTGQAYLVPWDGDPKFIDTTGYSVKRLYEKLNALKAKRILVAMDSCFSGIGGRSVIAIGTRPLVGRVDTGTGVAGRVAALTASASDEISGIDEASGHGLFTYHLLKALNAREGKATMKELFDALSPKVRDAARRDNRDQTPQLIGNGAASL